MSQYQVSIIGTSQEAMLNLARKYHLDVNRKIWRFGNNRFLVDAILDEQQIAQLKAAGYGIENVVSAEEVRKARQTAVGGEDYLEVEAVERAMDEIATPANAHFIELIPLPKPTWEGRKSKAVRIGLKERQNRIGVYFLGGMHGDELGGPDILINFTQQLAAAYRANTGITLGRSVFTRNQIRRIVENLDIFVFPQVNPDGRHQTLTKAGPGRKNRRPPADQYNRHGVDINRNFDFLWDFPNYFASGGTQTVAHSSTEPLSSHYIGTHAVSEPETKNVVSILDQHDNIRFLVDLHSAGEYVLINWGDDENQDGNPNMNFRNANYHQARGKKDGLAYREYIDHDDHEQSLRLANRLRDGIFNVGERRIYTVEQACEYYPTSGISIDYAYSRHLSDPARGKILGFTIELAQTHQVPYDEMKKVIVEVTAGLLNFCVGVLLETRPQKPIGSVDAVLNGGIVSGWALDPDDELASVPVDFKGGGWIGATLADFPRQVEGYEGHHGFQFVIPDKLRDGKPQIIYAGVPNGRNVDVLSGKAEFQITPGAQPPAGWLDSISSDGFAQGWCLDPDDPLKPVFVDIYIDTTPGSGVPPVARITANLQRPVLTFPGKNHGFRFSIPPPFRDGQPHTLYAFGIDLKPPAPNVYNNTLLGNSPMVFKVGVIARQPTTAIKGIDVNWQFRLSQSNIHDVGQLAALSVNELATMVEAEGSLLPISFRTLARLALTAVPQIPPSNADGNNLYGLVVMTPEGLSPLIYGTPVPSKECRALAALLASLYTAFVPNTLRQITLAQLRESG